MSYGDRQYADEIAELDEWYDDAREALNADIGEREVSDFCAARLELSDEMAERLTEAHKSYLERHPEFVNVFA